MENKFHYINPKETGSLLGAMLGAILSLKTHSSDEKPLSKAGKTILFTGLGFFAGRWFGEKIKKYNSFRD